MATNSTRPRNGNKPRAAETESTNASSSVTMKKTSPPTSPEDFMSALLLKYKKQLSTLRELFSETWKDEDLVAVLQEVEGDLEIAISRITEGHAHQWSTHGKKSKKEVPNKKAEPSDSQNYGVDSRKEFTGVRSSSKFQSSVRGRDAATRGRGRGRGAGRGGSFASTRSTPATDDSHGSRSGGWANNAEVNTNPSTSTGKWASAASNKVSEWGNPSPVVADESKSASWASDANPSVVSNMDDWSVDANASTTTSWADAPINVPSNASPATIAPVVSAPKTKTVSAKKGTWAQIAKPDPPVAATPPISAAAPVERQRSVSPKRQPQAPSPVPLKATNMPERASPAANTRNVLPSAPSPAAGFPPGLITQRDLSPSRSTSSHARNESPVVMPNSSASVAAAGVTFGSLSLADSSEPGKKSSVLAKTRDDLPQPSTSPASYLQNQVGDFGYDTARQPTELSSSQTAQAGSQGMTGYPPGMPANMANMYAAAAYFPIYMNHMSQFGGNPYAGANTHYSPQQSYLNNKTSPTAGAASGYMGYSNAAPTSTSPVVSGAAGTATTSGNPMAASANSVNNKQAVQAMYNAYYGANQQPMPGSGGDDASNAAAQEFARYQNAYMSQMNASGYAQYQPSQLQQQQAYYTQQHQQPQTLQASKSGVVDKQPGLMNNMNASASAYYAANQFIPQPTGTGNSYPNFMGGHPNSYGSPQTMMNQQQQQQQHHHHQQHHQPHHQHQQQSKHSDNSQY